MSAPSEGVVHRQHQLDNGLPISAEIDPQAVSAACGFFVDTGARDEPSKLMGVSHFLEHMAFKGSGDLTGEAIDKAFDDDFRVRRHHQVGCPTLHDRDRRSGKRPRNR